jgi:hypothetical protein
MDKGGDRPGKVTEIYAVSLASRLTERDRKIALDCFEHRVLTTEQLRRLHFNGTRTARARLGELYALRVLDRFRPPWQRGEGSTPYHWVLDEAGAHIVAQALGLERGELRWRHATAIAVAGSSKLQHQIEVNEFFTSLAKEVPAAGGKLIEWRGDGHAAKLLGGVVTPDGYTHLSLRDSGDVHLLLELDRATEDHKRLQSKARRYAKALPRSPLRDLDPLIILAVPTAARAAGAARALAQLPAPITPTVWTTHTGPALEIVTEAFRDGARPRPPAD